MKNAVAYCRVSTDKADQLNSFQTQKDFFNEYAKKNDINLVYIYADEGISGTKVKNRTAFNKMMADSEKGLFELVLVKDISRLARNTVDLLQSIRKLKSLNIETKFITTNMSVLGESEFMLTIFGALAQEESANMSKRVKFGKKITAEKGRVPNLCYGYNKIIGENYTLEVNEEQAAVVREIFDLYVNKGYGQLAVSNILNEKGYKSPRGRNWTQCSVKRILHNKIYAGFVINNKTEVSDFLTGKRTKNQSSEWIEIENPTIRIIDFETWQKAQAILKQQVDKYKCIESHSRRSNKYLFSTLIKCEDCNYSFRRIFKDYTTYTRTWWVCTLRNSHGVNSCCNKTTLTESELIKQIDDYLHNIVNNKEMFLRQCEKKIQEINSLHTSDNTLSEIEGIKTEIQKLKKTKDKQIEMYEDDVINRDELKERTSKINSKLSELEYSLSRLELIQSDESENEENKIKRTAKTLNEIDSYLSEYLSIANMTNEQLKSIIEKITVNHEGEVKIFLKNID